MLDFSLEQFETMCYKRDREGAMRALVALLQSLDRQYGGISDLSAQPLRSVAQPEVEEHLLSRAASAISCLMSDAELQISPQWQATILALHRWMGALFAATPLRNADHVMRALHTGETAADLSSLQLAQKDLLRFSLLYTPESEAPLDLDAMWAADKVLTASLCLVLVSPRFLGSPAAHGKREAILPWLTRKLEEIEDVESLPIGVLHDVYMHCSYADQRDKHAIKRPIGRMLRAKLLSHGLQDWNPVRVEPEWKSGKPVLMVVLEWFTSSHSIYRTHSLTLEGAREQFHVVGIGYNHCTDEVTRKVFDEFVVIEPALPMVDQIRFIQQTSIARGAAICYMPSVGMFPLTMWLANIRIAPLQMMALGHPATTHSPCVDYVVVEEDYVGDETCFSEKLLRLPSDGMPYRPSASAAGIAVVKTPEAEPEIVRIAMCATTMKLNPGFLSACAEIAMRAKVHVHYEFLIGQNQGLVRPALTRVVKQFLGDRVTVHPHLDYVRYMDVIAGCDMFINPFPFGNTNGIIDTVSAGLVGVCKTGPEVHEHIDQGLFERLGFPSWLVADTTEAYVEAAVRLAENHSERLDLRERLAGLERTQRLFDGRAEVMGQLFAQALYERGLSGPAAQQERSLDMFLDEGVER